MAVLTGWPVDEVVWLYSSELVKGQIHSLCKVTDFSEVVMRDISFEVIVVHCDFSKEQISKFRRERIF